MKKIDFTLYTLHFGIDYQRINPVFSVKSLYTHFTPLYILPPLVVKK